MFRGIASELALAAVVATVEVVVAVAVVEMGVVYVWKGLERYFW